MLQRLFISLRLYICIIIILICFPITIYSGCNNTTTGSTQRETLTQISTIDAILGGVYDGVIDFRTLKDYGDFGIGTFEGLDGEMVAFDSNFYQVKADGIAYPVTDSMRTPFASVTFFDVDYEDGLPEGIDYEQLPDLMEGSLPTDNIFYALKFNFINLS